MNTSAPSGELATLAAALGARPRLRALLVGAQTWDLLRGASTAGWFSRLRQPATASELARERGLPVDQVLDVLVVLTAAGVLERREDTFQLSPDLGAAAGSPSGVGLDIVVAELELERSRTAAAATGTVAAGTGDALVVARAWGLEATPAARELYAAVYAAVPEVEQRLTTAADYLDVGSGIGGNLLTTALLFPDVVATGIELDGEVGAELGHRVAAAGLGDRVTVRVEDAAELEDHQRFDVAYWAQEFFSEVSRPRVLAALTRAMRPGGWLLLQELAPDDATSAAAALDRLFRRGYDAARSRTAEALMAEAADAGLEPVGIRASPAGRLVLLRQPQVRPR